MEEEKKPPSKSDALEAVETIAEQLASESALAEQPTSAEETLTEWRGHLPNPA